MLPCALALQEDLFVIAFCSRDTRRRSHIFLGRARLANGEIQLEDEPRLALSPGPLGHFDADGVLTSSFLTLGGKDYLYYGGWENMVSVPYTANTGRLVFDRKDFTLRRDLPCPVLARNPQSPIFSGAPAFVKVGKEIWAWYTSALRWAREGEKFKHFYSLRRAVSRNGVDWISDPELAIPLADPHEYAVARSSILALEGHFYMWFSHRATAETPTYRIGFADSTDLLHWNRRDADVGIDVSASGWDSEMICYPHVVQREGWLYMLYNGNGYGESGFGYAVCKV